MLFATSNNEVVNFVENCSTDDWRKQCFGEGGQMAWAKMMVEGQALPDVRLDAIHRAGSQYAQEHADCAQEEVLGLLREEGASVVE